MQESDILKDIVKWDIASWSGALKFWEDNVNLKSLKCLALGECDGGLSLWLALKGNDVVCSDYVELSARALKLHEDYGVQDRISYQRIDATDIPYENEFDIVIFKSVAGGVGRGENLPAQYEMFRQIRKALKPGGKLLFAENMKGSVFHSMARRCFINWGNSWRYPSRSDICGFLSCYSSYKLKFSGFAAAFGRTEKQKRFLYFADTCFFNHILPAASKYIVFGLAEK